MQMVLASNNDGKVIEMENILNNFNISVISLKNVGINIEIEESGTTFEENALIKAREISKFVSMPVIADDSGLCVEALGNRPGVYSARYGGENSTSKDKMNFLLDELKCFDNTDAKFVCCIAVVFPDGREIVANGELKGRISRNITGDKGFGYDPIFIPFGFEKTLGELPCEIKNNISHRFNALMDLKEKLKGIF